MDFATEISLRKIPVVDEKIVILKQTEVKSQIGKSFKVSVLQLLYRVERTHNLWLLLVDIYILYVLENLPLLLSLSVWRWF